MKKGLRNVLLTCVLAFAGVGTTIACVSVSAKETATMVCADTFQEKVYTYSDDESVVTLTLLSETECSVRLQDLLVKLDETYLATYTRENNIISIIYNGNSVSVQVNDETMTFSQYVPSVESEKNQFEEIWEKFENWKETYLVPLLGGVSIASIISMIASILLTIIREKRATKRELQASEKFTQAQALIAKAYATIALVEEVFNHIKTQISQNDELRKEIEEKLTTLEKILSKNSRDIAKLNKIEPILKLLVQVQGKLALSNDSAITSGIVTDVNELVRLAKEF